MKRVITLLLILGLSSVVAHAANGETLNLAAEDIHGRPVKNVRFSTLAAGETSAPTDKEGRTKVALPASLETGESVALRVQVRKQEKTDWVFISPWDGRVAADGQGSPAKIVLARRGDREALESADGARAMTASVLAGINRAATPQQPVMETQRKRALAQQAERFGLSDGDLDKAIRTWKERTEDPYDRGIAALYERNYSGAVEQLEKSFALRTANEAGARDKAGEAAFFLGQALYEQGQYAKAAESFREAALRRSDDALTINAYGLALLRAGSYYEAKVQLERALSKREKTLGKGHPDVATSLNNLAGVYDAQWKLGEAEPLYKRALEIREKAFGKDHPDVAMSLINLGGLYHGQGKFDQAEPLYKRSLEIREKALGKDHPDVALSLDSLAELYYAEGKFDQAEPLYKRSLEIREKALGKDHPDVALSLNSLAGLYHAQGKYAEAEALSKRSLEIMEKTFGRDHPSVAASLNNLAALYHAQGKFDKAEPLYKRSLDIREKALGKDHPSVAASLNSLARLYHGQRKYAEAEPLYKRSLKIMEKTYGKDHQDVAASLNNLAGLYHAEGKYDEAEPLAKRALEIMEKAYGQDHPDVAMSMINLAELYYAQGKYAEAEPLYQRALEIMERTLGKDHPDVGALRENMADLHRRMRQKDEIKAQQNSVGGEGTPSKMQ
jgi:tetratricopeptide (TPR) repeat protein